MVVTNLATLPRTASKKFFHQEHHATTTGLIKDIVTTTTKGTDHTPIMVPDVGDVTADHSLTPIDATMEVAVLEGKSCTPLSATTAAQMTLQLMDPPVTPHNIVTPHPTLATSPTDTTHVTPRTRVSLSPATPSTQCKDPNAGKSSNAQDPHPPINYTTENCHHLGFSFRFFIRY